MSLPVIAAIGAAVYLATRGKGDAPSGEHAQPPSAAGRALGQEPVAVTGTVAKPLHAGEKPLQVGHPGTPIFTIGHDGAGPLVVEETGGTERKPTSIGIGSPTEKPASCACFKAPCACGGEKPTILSEAAQKPSGEAATRTKTPVAVKSPPIARIPAAAQARITRRQAADELQIRGPAAGAIW